jgi:phenylacetate-CoA ligase
MWGERIYNLLPVALQDAAVSIKGWQFHRDRYLSRSFAETTRLLEQNEKLSLADLMDLQFREFQAFAEHCYQKSSYYRQLWDSRQLRPGDIKCAQDIRSAPIALKSDLRGRTTEFFAGKINRGMTEAHTSGTTGSPLTVYFSSDDVGKRHAFLDRCRRWAGVRIGMTRATFTGRSIIPQTQSRPPYWRHNYAGNQLLFSSYHLTMENLPAYIGAMEEFQPQILDGYPSAIHIIAEHILRSGRMQTVRPHAILVSAETVLAHQRRAIEEAFGTKLYNQYASSEGAPFVSECMKGRLHVHTDSGLVEILDSKGNPVLAGQTGQMVVTSFTTRVVPLLRFAIGDMATRGEDERACECGLPFPTIGAIIGRVDDVLYTSDRGYVGRLDTVFKSVPSSIIEAQIVQTSPETIVLRVVPDLPKYRAEHSDRIVKEMRKRLGDVVAIHVEEVREIPRSANGKMRPVVNLCSKAMPSAMQYAEQLVAHTEEKNKLQERGGEAIGEHGIFSWANEVDRPPQ